MKLDKFPKLQDARYIGIKYGRDGVNVAMTIASKTEDGKIFVETIDCVSIRAGNNWLFEYFDNPKLKGVAIDGASGQELLVKTMKDRKIKIKPTLPTVAEIIASNSMFEQALYAKTLCHMGQESLANVVTNCEKRLIGSKGGFGYSSLVETQDIAIMDSMILAFWLCATAKEQPQRQTISI